MNRKTLFVLVLCLSSVALGSRTFDLEFPEAKSGYSAREMALRIRYICDPTRPTQAWGPINSAFNMSWNPEDTSVCTAQEIAAAQFPCPSNPYRNCPRIRKVYIRLAAPDGWEATIFDVPYAIQGVDFGVWSRARNPPHPMYLSAPIDRNSGKFCLRYHSNAWSESWMDYLYEAELFTRHPDVLCASGDDEIRLNDNDATTTEIDAVTNTARDNDLFFEKMYEWSNTPGDEFEGLFDLTKKAASGHSVGVNSLTSAYGWVNASISPYGGPGGPFLLGMCKDCSAWAWHTFAGLNATLAFWESQARSPEQGPVRAWTSNANKNQNWRFRPAGTAHMGDGGPGLLTEYDVAKFLGRDLSRLTYGGVDYDNATIIFANSIQQQWNYDAAIAALTLHGNTDYADDLLTPNVYAASHPGILIDHVRYLNVEYFHIPYGTKCLTLENVQADLAVNSVGSVESSSSAAYIDNSMQSSTITGFQSDLCYSNSEPSIHELKAAGLLEAEESNTLAGFHCTVQCQ